MSNCIDVAEPSAGIIPIYGQEVILATPYELLLETRTPGAEVFATVIYCCDREAQQKADVGYGSLSIYHLGEVSAPGDYSASLQDDCHWLNDVTRHIPGRRLECIGNKRVLFRADDALIRGAHPRWKKQARNQDHPVEVVRLTDSTPRVAGSAVGEPYFEVWPYSDTRFSMAPSACARLPFVKITLHNLPLKGTLFKAVRLRFCTNAGVTTDSSQRKVYFPVEGPTRMLPAFLKGACQVENRTLRDALCDAAGALTQPLPLQYDILIAGPEFQSTSIEHASPKNVIEFNIDIPLKRTAAPTQTHFYAWTQVTHDFNISMAGWQDPPAPEIGVRQVESTAKECETFALHTVADGRELLRVDCYRSGVQSVYWPAEPDFDTFCTAVLDVLQHAFRGRSDNRYRVELRGVEAVWRHALDDPENALPLLHQGRAALSEPARIVRFDTSREAVLLAPRPDTRDLATYVGIIARNGLDTWVVATLYLALTRASIDPLKIMSCIREVSNQIHVEPGDRSLLVRNVPRSVRCRRRSSPSPSSPYFPACASTKLTAPATFTG